MFGGIERGSGKRFVICLGMGGKRDRETLEPLIVRHILPGSTVISDCWRAYSNIPSLVDSNGQPLNYIHRTVNHAVGFVNSRNPWIHTQTIERLWGDLKDHIVGRVFFTNNVEGHVYRYLFLHQHKEMALHHLFLEAGKAFPFSWHINEPWFF